MDAGKLKKIRVTPGRVLLGITTGMQVAEEYLGRIHGEGFFVKYLEPQFLDKGVHAAFFYGAAEFGDDCLGSRASDAKRIAIILTLGTMGGFAKEGYDILNGLYFDPLDVAANYLGMLYYLYRRFRNRNKHDG